MTVALQAVCGGALVGASAAAVLFFLGRIAGVSGVLGGLLRDEPGERVWRAAFVAGLLAGGAALRVVSPAAIEFGVARPLPVLVLAGVLVGFGTRLGNGCTSGHGVCGIARGSHRSLVATLTFMATGMLTVWVTRLLWGAV